MADGLTGDFAALAALIKRLERLPADVKRESAKALRLELLSLVAEGFRTDTDPYGEAWAPLKHRTGDTLELSRIMANTFTVAPEWPLVIRNNVPYVNFHQDGTKKTLADGGERPIIPRRRMVPEPGQLPARWAGPLTKTTELVIEALGARMP